MPSITKSDTTKFEFTAVYGEDEIRNMLIDDLEGKGSLSAAEADAARNANLLPGTEQDTAYLQFSNLPTPIGIAGDTGIAMSFVFQDVDPA